MNIVAFPGHSADRAVLRSPSKAWLGWGACAAVAAAALVVDDVLTATAWAERGHSLLRWEGMVLLVLILTKLATITVATFSLALACAPAAVRSGDGGAKHWRAAAYGTSLFTILALLTPTITALVETASATPGHRVFAVRVEPQAVLAAVAAGAFFVAGRLSALAADARRVLAGFI